MAASAWEWYCGSLLKSRQHLPRTTPAWAFGLCDSAIVDRQPPCEMRDSLEIRRAEQNPAVLRCVNVSRVRILTWVRWVEGPNLGGYGPDLGFAPCPPKTRLLRGWPCPF
jgi:hypothetical protein